MDGLSDAGSIPARSIKSAVFTALFCCPEKIICLQLFAAFGNLYNRKKKKGADMEKDLYEILIEYILEDQNRFYRLAYSYVQNKDDALDIVQNAICRALERYETLRDAGAVRAWFYRILVNESLAMLRKRKEVPLPDDGTGAEIPYHEKGYDIQDDLYEQINRLNEEVQTVIKLRFYEELTLQEIAQITETNLNTVKARLYRGLKTLKQNIQEVDA